MLWNKDAGRSAGGFWRCEVKWRSFWAGPKAKAARERYNASPKGKARNARFSASPKGRARHERYDASPKGQERRWAQFKRELNARIASKRERIAELEEQLAKEDASGDGEGAHRQDGAHHPPPEA